MEKHTLIQEKSLEANRKFVDSLSNEELDELMGEFDNTS